MLTDPIYERDAYVFEFAATILEVTESERGTRIILDATALFPEGGGQQPDKGTIAGFPVTDVQIEDGEIVHYVDCSNSHDALTKGMQVACSVDKLLRLSRMQQHGAEHLICGIIHKKYGYDNVGFHMSDNEVVFDVSGPLSMDQIKEIERLANEAVLLNVPINIHFPSSDELSSIEYRSKLDITEGVRLVEIEGYDICACCAPQLGSTAEFGVIKIIDAYSHRGGTRMSLLAGITAYEDYAVIDDNNKGIRGVVSAKRYETYDKTVELDNKCKKLYEENITLKKEMTEFLTRNYLDIIESRVEGDYTPVLIFSSNLDNIQLRNIINACTEKYQGLVAGFVGNDEQGYRYIMAAAKNCHYTIDGAGSLKEVNALLTAQLGGRGGGNDDMVQGSISATEKDIKNILK